MSLVEDYNRQFAWRDWPAILSELPPLAGQTVIDLGCGVGDLSAELSARGARVVGVDLNEEVLEAARARGLPDAEFRSADLREELNLGVAADGIWASFVAAYFIDLPAALRRWSKCLKPGGWIALTEIDDLFGHEPLIEETKRLFAAYYDDALAAGRYDFQMGHKLKQFLEASGFNVATEMTAADQEFSFNGPARPDVLDGWRARLEYMKLLPTFFGEKYEAVRQEFLDCLARPDHRSTAKVYFCLATKAA